MKKKVISLLLTAAMATTMFAGCGSSSEENTTADNNQTAAPAATEAAAEESTEAAAPAVSADGKIAMITDSGDITDESFNQITWETCVAYGDKNGIEYQYYKPAEDTDEERINAIDLAVADGATVIVMPGYLFGPAIAEEQTTYISVLSRRSRQVTLQVMRQLRMVTQALDSSVESQFRQLSVMVTVIFRVSTMQQKRWALM